MYNNVFLKESCQALQKIHANTQISVTQLCLKRITSLLFVWTSIYPILCSLMMLRIYSSYSGVCNPCVLSFLLFLIFLIHKALSSYGSLLDFQIFRNNNNLVVKQSLENIVSKNHYRLSLFFELTDKLVMHNFNLSHMFFDFYKADYVEIETILLCYNWKDTIMSLNSNNAASVLCVYIQCILYTTVF